MQLGTAQPLAKKLSGNVRHLVCFIDNDRLYPRQQRTELVFPYDNNEALKCN